MDTSRRLVAEFVGTMFLLIAVVGSGIMAADLTADVGLQLFQNAFATAGALACLILAFGSISGAHFNPVVTVADAALGGIERRLIAPYIAAQTAGGIVGVIVANLMFDLPAVEWSTKQRSDLNLVFAEVIATLGLLLVIFLIVRAGRAESVAVAVAAYIGGAYYFTSSTSFANPAVTVARMFSDTFAGIRPADAPLFIVAQLVGLGIAIPLIALLAPHPPNEPTADDIDDTVATLDAVS